MTDSRLNLYRVDMKYIRDLHNADDKVSSVSPQIGKENRIYVGIVILCKSQKYIIPLSHPQKKHITMKPSADFDKIYDKKGRLIAVLNFNLMIPVEDRQLIKVDLKIKKTDSYKDIAYKNLCLNEIDYCRNGTMHKLICDKASNLYDLCTNERFNYKGKERCLNFRRLEEICKRYNEKLDIKDKTNLNTKKF